MRKGAATVSIHLIDSVPAQTKYMLISQKITKLKYMGSVLPMSCAPPPRSFQLGQSTLRIAWMASPPIQVWMPNQPQATIDRNSDGMCAPRVPNEARANTGNGMP